MSEADPREQVEIPESAIEAASPSVARVCQPSGHGDTSRHVRECTKEALADALPAIEASIRRATVEGLKRYGQPVSTGEWAMAARPDGQWVRLSDVLAAIDTALSGGDVCTTCGGSGVGDHGSTFDPICSACDGTGKQTALSGGEEAERG